MLLIDLRFFHAEEHEPTPRESATWVGIWVTLALAFGVVVFFWKGTDTGIEYFTGYLLEYSLSVDNMFVFVLIFTYFQVPFRYQHQVLFYGILGAMIFRGLFIVAGVSLIRTFDWIIYVFGAFLIITAVRIAISTEEVHPDENPILNFAKRRLPTTTKFDGQKLFTIENGKRVATPLLIVLIFIEITDIVFAVDSIPAIFGITDDPFIILTSNVFAILGLRALYFLLAGVIDRFHLLKYGLAVVLAFVGTKMLLEASTWGPARSGSPDCPSASRLSGSRSRTGEMSPLRFPRWRPRTTSAPGTCRRFSLRARRSPRAWPTSYAPGACHWFSAAITRSQWGLSPG